MQFEGVVVVIAVVLALYCVLYNREYFSNVPFLTKQD